MKHLSKKENRRRYRLHHTIKAAFHYHPKLKIIEADGRTKASAKVQRAVDELRTRFGYSVQATIPSIAQGDKARIHPKFCRPDEVGIYFEVVSLTVETATVKPMTGRWRKEFTVKTKALIAV